MNYWKQAAKAIGGVWRKGERRRPARPAGTRLGAECLEAREVPAAVFKIEGTANMDTFEFSRTGANRVLVTVNGATEFDGVVAAGDRFVLQGKDQIDTFNINSTLPGVAVVVQGGGGADFIDVAPSSSDLDGIRGRVVVQGGGGPGDTLRVHDTLDDTDNTFEVSATRVDRNQSAPVDYAGVETLQVFGGTGRQTFNVAGTAAGTATQLFGNQQGDTFHLGRAGQNLGGIDGTLVLDASSGNDVVRFYDANRRGGAAYTVTGSSLTRGGMAAVTTAQFETVNLTGSATARSVFNVTGTSSLAQTTLTGGTNVDVFNVGGPSGDLDLIGGNLALRGGRGIDRVNVNDSADSGDRRIELSAGTVDRDDAGLITYTGAEALSVVAGTGGDRIALVGAPALAVTVDGGGGSDTISAPFQNNTFRVTGTNAGTLDFATDLRFAAVENLEGNALFDRIEFASGQNTLTTPRIDGVFDGRGGDDTLDYSEFWSQFGFGVDVNLSAETATLTGGVAGVEVVEGSEYDDVLIGDSQDNDLRGNDGDDFLLGLQGIDDLTGGLGRDILVGGLDADELDAGEDEDILIGGSITFGATVTDLEDVMDEWQGPGDYLDRVNDLRDGTGLDLELGATVNHDAAGDTLTGGTDAADWFFANNADTRTDPNESGEQISS